MPGATPARGSPKSAGVTGSGDGGTGGACGDGATCGAIVGALAKAAAMNGGTEAGPDWADGNGIAAAGVGTGVEIEVDGGENTDA